MAYRHGIDRVELADPYLAGKRVGLITNHTGVNSNFERTVDVLHRRYQLVKIFAPEHGLDGVRQAGAQVDNVVDEVAGLPVLSMYKKGSTMDLDGVDVIAYDIQDVGVRFYTYISVLSIAMRECAKRNVPVVVFDRYNPLGLDRVSGTLLDEKFSSFVGMYPIPSQYGLTVGEYALYTNREHEIGCTLHVIPCQDLKRSDNYYTLRQPWINPSPNIPTFDSAVSYVGTVVFEGTNLSVGRGTTKPFEFIGAPFIDGNHLASVMNAKKLAGVYFRPIRFVPSFSKNKDLCCGGVQLHVTDYDAFDSFYSGLILLDTVRKTYAEARLTPALVRLLGTDEILAEDFDADAFAERHRLKIAKFTKRATKYYLYD